KRGPALTKEKLAEILGGDASKKEAEERAAKEAEAAASRSEKQQRAAATKVPDEGPLLSDEEFNSIQTTVGDLEIETEFSFDSLADKQLASEKSGFLAESSSGEDYGVIDFESVPAPQEEILVEEPVVLEPEAVPDLELTEPELIEVEPVTSCEEDPGELIIDDFETDFDDEIAEIFIEEIQEVLENIREFYPQWKNSNFA